MNDILNDQSKRPNKGDAIKIDVGGAILTCTVEMMLPRGAMVAKTPDGERILAVRSPTAESQWVKIQCNHDWNTPYQLPGRWEMPYEVGVYVDINLEIDDGVGGKTTPFGVIRGKVVAVDEDGNKRFAIHSFSLYADEDDRLRHDKSQGR